MEHMLGACGLVCSECEAFRATQNNDAKAIAQVAAQWSKQFATDISSEAVWCDGCLAGSKRKCGHCADCEIRACVVNRGLTNCAGCDDYACDKLDKFFDMVPCCKGRLDAIRAG